MDVKKDEEASRVQPTPLLCSTRLGLSILGFFMFFHMYAQRVGMSVAIVSMVNQTAVSITAAGNHSTLTYLTLGGCPKLYCCTLLSTFRASQQSCRCELDIHCVSKTGAPTFVAITLSSLNRFSKFFHCRILQEICSKVDIKEPATL